MKSMLYVGATLMIGASIYGFADFKKASHRKDFNEMYTQEQKTVPAETKTIASDVKAPEPVKAKPETRIAKKNTTKKITAKKEEFVVIDPVIADEKIAEVKVEEVKTEPAIITAPEEKKEIAKAESEEKITKVSDAKENKEVKTEKKKKRKLSSKLFSRAPLRD